MKVSIDKTKRTVTIEMPLELPLQESKSGKSMMLVNTHGFTRVPDVAYDGKPVSVYMCVTIPK